MVLGFCCALIGLSAGGCVSAKRADYQITTNYTVRDPQFVQAVGNLFGPPLIPGNSCATLLNGKRIFPAMLRSIRTAHRTITLETYIYWSGTIGEEFTEALAERAAHGVKVHVMIDWLGSARIDQAYLKRLSGAGVQVMEYHAFHLWDPSTWRQIDNRTHRKLLVVDGRVGFIGGVGIADEWRGDADQPNHWRDNHYLVEGPIVGQLQAAFLDNWMKTTGAVLTGDDYLPDLKPAGHLWAQVFRSSSEGGSQSMQLLMMLSLAAAGQNVRLESAYFVPDETTRKSLIDARRRGVSVEIIVPGRKIDEKIVRQASRACWGEMLKAGVRIYEYQPTMFHCKQLIVDEYWTSIGSSNLDNRSFQLNDEANLNVLDPEFARGQIRIFEEDKARAREITYQQWEARPLIEKIRDKMSSVLAMEM